MNNDGPSDEYRVGNNGAHPTLAGNILDPNVSADGAMSGNHQGVGGTSEGTVRREGLEHIKNQSGIESTGSSGLTGTGTSGMSSTAIPQRSGAISRWCKS